MTQARDRTLENLCMVATLLLEHGFHESYGRWRVAGSQSTVRRRLEDESADALALCRQLQVPVPEVRR